MPLIGARELHEKTSEVLRQVREEQAEYVITYQGRPMALLVPVNTESVEAQTIEASKLSVSGSWQRYFELAEAARQAWISKQSTQEIMDDIRGD